MAAGEMDGKGMTKYLTGLLMLTLMGLAIFFLAREQLFWCVVTALGSAVFAGIQMSLIAEQRETSIMARNRQTYEQRIRGKSSV